jgi:hypothetical protein
VNGGRIDNQLSFGLMKCGQGEAANVKMGQLDSGSPWRIETVTVMRARSDE